MVPRFCRLCARRPLGLRGLIPSLGCCAKTVGDAPRGSRLPPASPPDSSMWTRPPRPPCASASTASFSLEIERRFREAGGSQGSAPSRVASSTKAVAHVFCRLGASANGTTSPSAAGSPPRSVRQRVDLPNDEDQEPTLVLPATAPGAAADGPGRPHTDLEARLTSLHRGRALAGTLVRPEVDILEMNIVATTEVHRRHILTIVPRLAQQARYCAARILPARSVQPETIGLHAGRGGEHPLGPRRGLAHTGPQW